MSLRKKLPKYHHFNGKKYNLKWRKPYKCMGLCDDPSVDVKERFITVDPKLPPLELFETILHEGLHAEQWYLDEETVTRIAENLTALLDKCELIKK